MGRNDTRTAAASISLSGIGTRQVTPNSFIFFDLHDSGTLIALRLTVVNRRFRLNALRDDGIRSSRNTKVMQMRLPILIVLGIASVAPAFAQAVPVDPKQAASQQLADEVSAAATNLKNQAEVYAAKARLMEKMAEDMRHQMQAEGLRGLPVPPPEGHSAPIGMPK